MIKKVSKYSFLFIKLSIILIVIFVVDSSSTVKQHKVVNENFNRNFKS